MADSLHHRGPDDQAWWTDPEYPQLALAFRRLAIMDLSQEGRQPMLSPSGRFVLLFNGEIYNFQEIRSTLRGKDFTFRGHSDTEVVAACLDDFGLIESLMLLHGMFAIAVWDRRDRVLQLARDRMGIKPLYVQQVNGEIRFASELKAILRESPGSNQIESAAAIDFLRFLYVPGPQSILKGVIKLPPGHHVTIVDPASALPRSNPFWSLKSVVHEGISSPLISDDETAISDLESRVRVAVHSHARADVPLGTFLSGGIDSSLVTALLREVVSSQLQTFSVSFDDRTYNEAEHAGAVASFLGTDHHEFRVTGDDALQVVPSLPEIFDEPHADSSQIPMILLSQLARQHVKVALSGDGGDEIFGGYNRYAYGDRIVRRVGKLPRAIRHRLAIGLDWLSAPRRMEFTERALHRVVSGSSPRRLGDKTRKIGRLLQRDSDFAQYLSLLEAWPTPPVQAHQTVPTSRLEGILCSPPPELLYDRMILADQLTYLPEDQLAKVDRASMAASLEVRVPLVDHRLVEYSWKFPRHLRVRRREAKWLLRQVLYRQVPREIVDRPKMGLSVPVTAWLRGPLRPWAEELLTERALRESNLLDPVPIRIAWGRLMNGTSDDSMGLWAVLMLQSWRMRWGVG